MVLFSVTAVLVWRVLVAIAGEAAGLAGLAAFLFSPLGLLVSRMSLIEYMATAGSLAFVLWGLRWHETGKWRWYAAALVAGAVGLLVKSTTGVIYLVPLAVLVLGAWWKGRLPVARRSVYALAIVALFGIPLILAAGWTIYADGVRASNPESAWFSSSGGLAGYYLGTLQQKLDPTTWFTLADEAQGLMFGGTLWLWVLLALAGAMLLARRAFAVALVLSAAIGPVLFTTQYLVPGQEYYMAAISPLVAIGIGLAAGWLWRERHQLVTSPRTGNLNLPLSAAKFAPENSLLGVVLLEILLLAVTISFAGLLLSSMSALADLFWLLVLGDAGLFAMRLGLAGIILAKRSTNSDNLFSSRLNFFISPRCAVICFDSV